MDAKLPFPMYGLRVATINNRVLCFGNSRFVIKEDSLRFISSGGNSPRGYRKDILEFNHESESWTGIGAMKEPKGLHAVSVVSFDDYEKWCK